MKTKSRLLISLVLGLSALQGCATAENNRAAETQPAEKAQVAEIAIQSSARETVMEKPAAAPEQVVVKAIPKLAVTPTDRYTVVAGDTLATIAVRPDVYGDARLWPLLYVANNSQIGPQGLIYPKQVLAINRNFTIEDVKALTGRSRLPAQHAPAAAKPSAAAPKAGAPSVADKTSAPKTAAVDDAKAQKKTVTKQKEESKPAVAEAKPQEATDAKPKEESKPELAEAKPQEAAATKSKDEVKPAEYLPAARRAFTAGDVPWAIYYYNAYLEGHNRDADAWGELGNVYYFDGSLAESAQAYFNAANVLIDRGHTARAMQLMPAIEEGNPALSEAIYLRLTTVKR